MVTLSGVGGPWTLLCTKVWWFSWGKFLGSCLSSIQNGLFFHGMPFYWITRVIQTLVWGRHFLQNTQNEPNTLRGKKKNLTVFVANDKIRDLKQKLEIWKIYFYFLILKDCSNEIDGGMNKYDCFGYNIEKCVNIWKRCITHWINVFQIKNVQKIICKEFIQKVRKDCNVTVQEVHWHDFIFLIATYL